MRVFTQWWVLLWVVLVKTASAQVAFPVKISPNKRYLVDARHKPFPILGRTAWCIITQTEKNYRQFIENTLSHGYNAIEISVITHWPTSNHAPFNADGEAPFLQRLNGTAWDGKLTYDTLSTQAPDLLTPNEKYWKVVDTFLAYCESKGILVFMFPGYVGYAGQEQGWMKELMANGPKTEAYGAWIANRYKKRKNIVWMLLGDMGKFSREQQQAEAALIRGLKSVSGQQSIQYTAESGSGENAADNAFFGHEMTLNGVYTWDLLPSVPMLARKAYSHIPTMPAFLLEEPYDEEGPDGNNYNKSATQPVRRFQWWGWLGTTAGYISGNGYVWPFIDPVWQQHLNTQGAYDMEHLNAFIRSITWWELVPSGLDGLPTLIADPANSDSTQAYVSAAATKAGTMLVAYVPPAHQGAIPVAMSAMSKSAYAYWFDPTSGQYTAVGKEPIPNQGVHEFTIPGKNKAGATDWTLLLTTAKR